MNTNFIPRVCALLAHQAAVRKDGSPTDPMAYFEAVRDHLRITRAIDHIKADDEQRANEDAMNAAFGSHGQE